MQNLKITLVQANQFWEDKDANLKHYEKLLADLLQSDLIVLPEMFHTAFSMNAPTLSESNESSMGLDWLKKMAISKQTAIYTSLIFEDTGAYFNRGLFVFPDGTYDYYDKRKSFGLGGEDKVFTSGEREKIISYRKWKINLQICYDLRFPELIRNRLTPDGLPAYDLLLYVANWPERRSEHWKALLKARAIENQCYVVGVNRVGEDGKGLIYSGDSMVVDALGNSTSATIKQEEVLTVELSRTLLDEVRTNLPFLQDA